MSTPDDKRQGFYRPGVHIMRVISSGIEALVTARQLDEKIASKKIPVLASSSSRPDFLDPSVTIS
ncbi:hypothetical protein ALO63_05257, partial [Pseudomonas amygdali pv. mori]